MKCKAHTRSGAPCMMPAKNGQDFCFTHSPSAAVARAKAHRKGGAHHREPTSDKSMPEEVKTLADANKILTYVLAETVIMQNSIARNRLLLSCFDSFLKSFEIGELEARIAMLEGLQSPSSVFRHKVSQ